MQQHLAEALERAGTETQRVREEAGLRWAARVQHLEATLHLRTRDASELEAELVRHRKRVAELEQHQADCAALAEVDEMGLQALLDAAFAERRAAEQQREDVQRHLADLQQVAEALRATARHQLEESDAVLKERETSIAALEQSLCAAQEAASLAAAEARAKIDSSHAVIAAVKAELAREQAQRVQSDMLHEQQMQALAGQHESALATVNGELQAVQSALATAIGQLQAAQSAQAAHAVEVEQLKARLAEQSGAREELMLALRQANDAAERERQDFGTRLDEARQQAAHERTRESRAHAEALAALRTEYQEARATSDAALAEVRAAMSIRLQDQESRHVQAQLLAQERLEKAQVDAQQALSTEAENGRSRVAERDALLAALRAKHEEERSLWTRELVQLRSDLGLARRQTATMRQAARTQAESMERRMQALERQHAADCAAWAARVEQGRRSIEGIAIQLDAQLGLLQHGPGRLLRGGVIRGLAALRDQAGADSRALEQGAQLIAAPAQPTADLPALLAQEGAAFVEAAYRALLHREPDPDGLRHYLERMASGTSRWRVLADLRQSPEGRRLLPTVPGLAEALTAYARSAWPLVGPAHRRQLAALLGRMRAPVGRDTEPSATAERLDELREMLRDLHRGTAMLAEVVPVAVSLGRVADRLGLDAWSSARDLVHATGADFVRQTYALLLGCEPDEMELRRWQEQLAAGASRFRVIDSVIDKLQPVVPALSGHRAALTADTADAAVAMLRLGGSAADVQAQAQGSRADWLCLLAPSTTLAPGAAKAMVSVFEANSGVGLVGAAVAGADGRLLHAGGLWHADNGVRWLGQGSVAYAEGQRHVRGVDLPGDAAFMIPRLLFEADAADALRAPVGTVAAAFALALKKRGYRSLVAPQALAHTSLASEQGPDLAWLRARFEDQIGVARQARRLPLLAIRGQPLDAGAGAAACSEFNLLLTLQSLGADIELVIEGAWLPAELQRADFELRGIAVSGARQPAALAEHLAGSASGPQAVLLWGSAVIARHSSSIAELAPHARRIGVLGSEPLPSESALQALHLVLVDSMAVVERVQATLQGLPACRVLPMLDTARGPLAMQQRQGIFVASGSVGDDVLRLHGRAAAMEDALVAVATGNDPASAAAAMAAGLPVVMTPAVAGELGVVHDQQAIVVVDADSAGEAAGALIQDAARWQRLAEATHRHAQERFGSGAAARELSKIMQQADVALPGTGFKARFLPTSDGSTP